MSLSRFALVIGSLLATITAADSGGRAATEMYPGLATLPAKNATVSLGVVAAPAATALAQAQAKPPSDTKSGRRPRRTRLARQEMPSVAALERPADPARPTTGRSVEAAALALRPTLLPGVEAAARTPADTRASLDNPQETAAPTIASLIAKHAEENGVPIGLAQAVVSIESRGNAHAAHAGAMGLMQIKAQTARAAGFVGEALGLLDAETNLRYGMKVLAQAYRDSGGNVCRALMKYQSGHLAVHMTHANRVYCTRARAVMAGA